MNEIPVVAAPEPALSQPPQAHTMPPSQRSKLWLWISLAGLVVVLGVGGYFAYARGYISIPGLSPKADELFATMVAKMEKIENAEYGLSVSIDSVDRPSGAKATFSSIAELENSSLENSNIGLPDATGGLLGLVDPSAMIQALPSDIHLQAGMTLQAETNKVLKDADGNLHLTGVYQGGDSTYNVDIEAKKVGENIYFILNKIPGLPFFDLTSIKGSWVAVTPDDSDSLLGDSWKDTDPQQGSKQLQKYISIALKKNIVTVKKQLPAITVDGVKAAQYQIEFHVDQLLPVYQEIKADLAATNASTTSVDQIIAELQKDSTKQTLQRMADASVITVAVDKVQGFLRKVEWKLTVVPPDDIEKLKEKQFVFDTVFTLNKINAAVQVEAPSKPMPWDEMMRKITGVTKAEQDFQEQASRVRTVRYALADYRRVTGTFPATLTNLKEELQKEVDACKAKKERTCSTYSYSTLKANSTTDKITNAPFVYTRTSTDNFTLVYQMHLDSSIDSYSVKQYVEGKNTSTKEKISVEGKYEAYDMDYLDPITNTNSSSNSSIYIEPIYSTNTNSRTNTNSTSSKYSCLSSDIYSMSADTDKDTLSDYNEVYYYMTNPCLVDTDGDSYSDDSEVKTGYNPVGTGKATEVQKSLWPKTQPVTINSTYYPVTQSGTTATVTWKTDVATDGALNYGESVSYGGLTNDYTFQTQHTLTFQVQAGRTYHYAIRSCVQGVSATEGCSTSQDYTYLAK